MFVITVDGGPSVRLEHDLDEDRCAERRRAERRRQAVEPEAAVEVGDVRAHEEQEPDVAERVEGEIEDVSDRRERRVVGVGEDEEQVGQRPRADRRSQQAPGEAIGADVDDAEQAKRERRQLDGVVDVVVEEGVRSRPADAGDGVREEDAEGGGRDNGEREIAERPRGVGPDDSRFACIGSLSASSRRCSRDGKTPVCASRENRSEISRPADGSRRSPPDTEP